MHGHGSEWELRCLQIPKRTTTRNSTMNTLHPLSLSHYPHRCSVDVASGMELEYHDITSISIVPMECRRYTEALQLYSCSEEHCYESMIYQLLPIHHVISHDGPWKKIEMIRDDDYQYHHHQHYSVNLQLLVEMELLIPNDSNSINIIGMI